MRLPAIVLLTLALLPSPTAVAQELVAPAPAFREAVCEGAYPRHVQGICTDGKGAIYWSWTEAMVKTDLDGKILKKVPAADHHGHLCFHDGL